MTRYAIWIEDDSDTLRRANWTNRHAGWFRSRQAAHAAAKAHGLGRWRVLSDTWSGNVS